MQASLFEPRNGLRVGACADGWGAVRGIGVSECGLSVVKLIVNFGRYRGKICLLDSKKNLLKIHKATAGSCTQGPILLQRFASEYILSLNRTHLFHVVCDVSELIFVQGISVGHRMTRRLL